ncbi:MAG TPA: SWIM zinc finger family protein [Pirellulales bacterium]|nr:SWIM zinc finger family protein [Pirellulales bacterium]
MSAGLAIDFRYLYRGGSCAEQQAQSLGLRLATFGGPEKHPCFFDAKIAQPRVVSAALLTVAEVVRTHFFLPRPGLLDPVVTCNDHVLRFEGFSACCGAYVRADFADESFDRPIAGRGTTNVDFNNEMRRGLTRLRSSRDARISVGAEELSLHVDESRVVEKKVKLPLRWIKSFCETTAYLPRMQPKFTVSGSDLLRFLRSLARDAAKSAPAWVVKSGSGLRLSLREAKDGVRVMAAARLRVLESVAQLADSAEIYASDETGVSAWDLRFPTGRLTLLLSPELYRGFSGEGQALESLAATEWKNSIDQVRAALTWNRDVDSNLLAAKLKLPAAEVDGALVVLGTRGLVGYDLAAQKYFHRELPFDLSKIEELQPRLTNARKLLAAGRVSLHCRESDDRSEVLVSGSDVEYLVRLAPDKDRCTCPWYAKHQGARGPCKHVLAARLFLDGESDESC